MICYTDKMDLWVLKRKVHSSWLVAFLCFGVYIGVLIAGYIGWPDASSIAIMFTALILAFAGFSRRYIYLIPFIIVSGILFGMWRGTISQDELSKLKPLYGKSIKMSGSIVDDVDTSQPNQIVVRLGNARIGKVYLPGIFYVTSNPANTKRGDSITINGELQKGFGSFSGVIYRAKIEQVVEPKPGDIARQVRDWFANGVHKAIPEPEASLGIGYLVGQRRTLPMELITALQVVGLTHIVIASGYNLTVLVRFTRRVTEKLSKYLSTVISGFFILAFMAVTGVSPSMARAGLITGLSLAAWYYGRKFNPIVLLLIAVAVTIVINPSYAWGDLGWSLSFAAFTGVMIIAPLGQRYFFGENKPGVVRQILGETISAQLATAPLLIMSFGQISNIGILSNLLILPLVPAGMILTFFAGIGGLTTPFLSIILGFPAKVLLGYMVTVINLMANLPWVVSQVNLPVWGMAVLYMIIVGLCVYMWGVTKYDLSETNVVE